MVGKKNSNEDPETEPLLNEEGDQTQSQDGRKKPEKPPYPKHWTRRWGRTLGTISFLLSWTPPGAALGLYIHLRSQKDHEAEEKHYKPPPAHKDDDYKKAWFREDPVRAAAFSIGFGLILFAPIIAGYFIYAAKKDRDKEAKWKHRRIVARRDARLAAGNGAGPDGQGQKHGISSQRDPQRAVPLQPKPTPPPSTKKAIENTNNVSKA